MSVFELSNNSFFGTVELSQLLHSIGDALFDRVYMGNTKIIRL